MIAKRYVQTNIHPCEKRVVALDKTVSSQGGVERNKAIPITETSINICEDMIGQESMKVANDCNAERIYCMVSAVDSFHEREKRRGKQRFGGSLREHRVRWVGQGCGPPHMMPMQVQLFSEV
jgi:hypothetical protein